jgi:hypothetical protein
MSPKAQADTVTASEIASWVYCPEQWRLEYGLKLPPGNRPVLDCGTRHHADLAATERTAGGAIAFGFGLIALALLALALIWFLSR